jgi:hypothetical protein
MYHPTVRAARNALNDWIARYTPMLADEAASADAADMVISLARLARFTRIQLDAMAEQWSQDKLQELGTDEQM